MSKTGKEVIAEHKWAKCRICFNNFGRQTPTSRWCYECHNGFCEGEHGFYYPEGPRSLCVVCANGEGSADYKKQDCQISDKYQ